MKLSIVSPVYGAEKIIDELVSRIIEEVVKITDDFEIILVEDGSSDQSWQAIERNCYKENKVKGIKLSRNFGQHYAITAGLAESSGDYVVVMDCDLQDNPNEIPNLYAKAKEGYDIVLARRVERQDKFLKRLSSSIFHVVFSYLSDIKTDKSIANFGIYNQKVIREYNRMKETARSFPSLVAYLGFSKTTIDVRHTERYEGNTSYSFSKLLNLALDIALSNSNKPLRLTVKLGFLMAITSFTLALYNIVAHLIGIVTVQGFTSTIFSIWFVGGLILCVLGVLGLYIGKIFDQVKERPLFVVSKRLNVSDEN